MKFLVNICTLVLLFSFLTYGVDLQYESTITELKCQKNSSELNSYLLDNNNLLNNNECRNSSQFRRIAKGHAAKNCQFPFVAELIVNFESKRKGICTGSLVAPRWILTAKHCFFE